MCVQDVSKMCKKKRELRVQMLECGLKQAKHFVWIISVNQVVEISYHG